jgi:hypothetical protein
MEPFATVEQYEARYGEVEDQQQVETLLGDASAFIAKQPGFSLLGLDDDGYDLQQANLVRVTCAVVHRSLMSGDLSGFSQVSESAVGISASATVYNPGEDFYLTRADRVSLGLSGGRVGMTDPYGEA